MLAMAAKRLHCGRILLQPLANVEKHWVKRRWRPVVQHLPDLRDFRYPGYAKQTLAVGTAVFAFKTLLMGKKRGALHEE
jgi:hypothetical protein